ncbi:MAG TPA: hypothetical protein ENJ89_01235 [Caldithrix abyssi]|uniref:Uncharacterized protein n=1 Tax=Caldithrix abyssi TaxID=187145 RepID=A0A7V5PMG9_CALAY|nr:hypothetical protein [Caldithrix abyssi]
MNFRLPVKFILLFLITLFFFTCGRKKEKDNPFLHASPFPAGRIISDVKFARDTAQSFSLYLPKKYEQSESLPVLYFFDAHRRGLLPVQRYRALADSFGYILIGSNNIKNGLSGEELRRLSALLLTETGRGFKIDPKRMYLMGFSGGAKGAVLTAIEDDRIRGVIACAGGFPQNQPPDAGSFEFAGIVGKADFNYWELRILERDLNATSRRHILIVHNGKHAWPPYTSMARALDWFDFNAARDGLLPLSRKRIQGFLRRQQIILANLRRKGDLEGLAEEYRYLIRCLDGLHDTGAFREALKSLTGSPGYRKLSDRIIKIARQEFRQRQHLPAYLMEKGANWWQETIHSWDATSDSASEAFWSRQRLKSFAGLLVYLYASQALSKQQTPVAQKLLSIYALLEPNNPDRYYLQAWLHALQGKAPLARKEVQQALSAGIDDPDKIRHNPVLQSLNQP